MTILERKLVTCPHCEQQYEDDEDDTVFELMYCGHWVCVCCSFDHIEECRDYWKSRKSVDYFDDEDGSSYEI